MAQDQTKKDETFDLAGEIRRMAATTAAEGTFGAPLAPLLAPSADEPAAVGKPPPLPRASGLENHQVPPIANVGPASGSASDNAAALSPELPPQPPRQPASEAPRKGERRPAKRRAAAPSRDQIAANDDAPSIGGLIYALNQKPSRRPFGVAATTSLVWSTLTLGFAAYFWGNDIVGGAGLSAFIGRPEFLTLVATVVGPVGLFFGLATIAYRSEEMRLRSSAMTEVAVRLAEPDRMAEQSVASLGQAVRRQVSFMNDAVSRALGRAGELEALVHNEVAALERSYEENERKIRGLIQELAGERDALVNTSDRVSGNLRTLGTEVPELIEKLSAQQIKLAGIIEGAGQNLTALETAIATQTGSLEHTLGNRTHHLQSVLTEYTSALSSSLDQRMEQIGTTIASRTGDLQMVFEEYTRALDSTMANRAEAMDSQIVERTQAIGDAFSDRLRLFDESLLQSTAAIDHTIGDRTIALTNALDHHAKSLGETLSRQSMELDESLLQGIGAVRRTSENITRQSIKAIEGLAGQSELLKNVSENLLGQINSITNRFENQGQQIMRSANALESVNYKIDKTLQARHGELAETLDRMSGKADELGLVAHGYSRQIEGTMTEAERRARALTSELAHSAEQQSRSTIADIERLTSAAGDTTTRALEDLRSRFSNVSSEVTQSLGTLSSQFTETSGDVRRRAAEASSQLASEQERLRQQIQSLPDTTREGTEAMRKVLHDHMRALDQLSNLSQREAGQFDVSRPVSPMGQAPARQLVPIATSTATREEQTRALSTLSSALSQQMQSRARPQQQTQQMQQPAGRPAPAAPGPAAPDAREGWSLGDLLKRASFDDDPAHAGGPANATQANRGAQHAAPVAGASLDIAAVARAIDPATAAAIWQRLGTGQRGIMVRSIYQPEGRVLFDETVQRLQADPGFGDTTRQYLADFERVLQESERQDPSGRIAQGHLSSDYGRVYLFLAHASGRIS